MRFKKIPYWILSGILIFPLLIFISLVLFIFTQGKVSYLFWLVIPSIIFEELFEAYFYVLSNNQIANLVFAFIFWFSIGSFISWITLKIKKI